MGHVYRQLHLAKILRDRGMEIAFFVSNHPPSLQLLRKETFCFQVTEDDGGLPKEEKETFDAVILDLRDTQTNFIRNIRQRAKNIVSFENLGPGRNYVDLLIDANINSTESNKVKSSVTTLLGLPYCVLSPAFAEFHQQERKFSSPLESLLVTMGGTDPNSLTLKLAEVLCRIEKNLAVTFVLGPGCKGREEVEKLILRNLSFKILTDVSNMAELLFSHQAVFCSGGVTLHEALAVGTPAFVISQVPHQQDKTLPIETSGAAMNLGLAGDFDPEKILASLAISKNQLESMSRKGKELVDGQGIYRVADEIETMISN